MYIRLQYDHLTSELQADKPSFLYLLLVTGSFSKMFGDLFLRTWHYAVMASRTCARVPGPLVFQRATLKNWEWPGDEASGYPGAELLARMQYKCIINAFDTEF